MRREPGAAGEHEPEEVLGCCVGPVHGGEGVGDAVGSWFVAQFVGQGGEMVQGDTVAAEPVEDPAAGGGVQPGARAGVATRVGHSVR